jgi:hypothetical protein
MDTEPVMNSRLEKANQIISNFDKLKMQAEGHNTEEY